MRAQLGKCLPCNKGDLSSNPQYPCKSQNRNMSVCNASASMERPEMEAELPEALRLTCLLYTANNVPLKQVGGED